MNLQLSLKRQWFEMTKAGIKTEDYREINEYWCKRLLNSTGDKSDDLELIDAIKGCENKWSEKITDSINRNSWFLFKDFTINTMTLDYPKSTDKERILKLEHKGIEIRYGRPEFGAEPNKLYFVIKHGRII